MADNLANWLSSGTYGVAHGAIFPEELLSFDHIASSVGMAIMCYPAMKKIALPGVDYLHVGNNIQTPSSYPTNKTTYSVDPHMQAKDLEMGVLDNNGSYLKNPTAQNIDDLIKSGSNYVGNSKMNGQYMYVIDVDGNIVIGTRAGTHMPHPTLIGGENPNVLGAGIVDIRGGKIFSVDNASGHFKPDASSLLVVSEAFEQLPSNVFHKDFQGYLLFSE